MTNRSDNFNRAAGAIGTPSDGGSSWIDSSGTWVVTASNVAGCSTTTAQSICVLDSGSSNVEVQTTVVGIGGAADAGISFRSSDANNYCLALFASGSSNPRVFTCIAGSFTEIGTAGSATLATNDVWKVVANGTSVEIFQNDVSRWTGTVSFGSSNTRHGLRANGDFATRFDDFSITDIGGGGGATLPGLERITRGQFRGQY